MTVKIIIKELLFAYVWLTNWVGDFKTPEVIGFALCIESKTQMANMRPRG